MPYKVDISMPCYLIDWAVHRWHGADDTISPRKGDLLWHFLRCHLTRHGGGDGADGSDVLHIALPSFSWPDVTKAHCLRREDVVKLRKYLRSMLIYELSDYMLRNPKIKPLPLLDFWMKQNGVSDTLTNQEALRKIYFRHIRC